jgi:hypothetical protein
MALVVYDRVQETTATTGTGTITLGGAVAGYQSFAVVGNGNTTFYCIVNSAQWEVGIGTYTSSGTTLARTTVLSNSNGNTSPITLSGASNVFVTYPSEKSVNLDASGNVSPLGTIASGVWQGTTVGVSYGGTGVTASSGANSVVLRDANVNASFNNFITSAIAVTAAAGTTVLTAASARTQILVGSTTQIFQLPNATTLALGQSFIFVNNSSGALTVKDSASTTVELVPSGGVTQLAATSIATSAGSWGAYSFIPAAANWGTNSLDLASTVISGGTWQGGTIQSGYGGTGLTTFTAANYALYSTSASALTAGTLPVAAGGTGMTTATANGVFYGNGTSAHGVTAAGTTGQVLIATTSGAPSWGSVPTTAAVTSLSFGTTGLTPATATTGAITVAGTLVAANGGTGQSSYAVGDILYASTTTALSKLADVATGNALISGGVGVAPSYGKIGLTTHVSGTLPIANGGTGSTSTTYCSLTANVTGTLPVANGGTGATTATANTVFAGPTTGAAAAPSFRALVAADIPSGYSEFASGTALLFYQAAAPTGWTKSVTNDNKALRVVSGATGGSAGGSVAFTTAFASQAVSGTVGTTGSTTATGTNATVTGTVSTSITGVSGSVSTSITGVSGSVGTSGSTTATGSVSAVTGTISGTVGNTTLTESQMPSHVHTMPNQQMGLNGTAGSSMWTIINGAANTNATGGNGAHNHSFSGSFSGSTPTFTGVAHTHTGGAFTFSSGTASSSFTFSSGTASSSFTGSAPAFTGAAHNHTGGTFTGTAINLAVQYIDVIVATKN